MKILYVGDIMGKPGIEVVEQVVPKLRAKHHVDLVIAQAENVTDGRGITPTDYLRLQKAGIDFCTGGNWSLHDPSIIPMMNDPNQPIIRPANYPSGTPGLGYKYIQTPDGRVLVISLLGKIVGKDADKPLDNSLQCIDEILKQNETEPKSATVVNFHGDYSSEKVVIGHYLDGRVTAVVGDHWHVPTADARILPSGTAHITDVGMCGTLDASLGVTFQSVIPRWRDGIKTRNELETNGQRQFNGLMIETNDAGLATAVQPMRSIL
ncbi:MAG TPA: TIGR00282 family metallophosphoesterase [Candidatus Dormibacteraeota bacterium]|nr:TIGR00282 family metallophosphoesterase [Candidatus Dormibacteraeota bacterium]